MNIVFDLGGVVFDWNPESIIHRLFQDSETRNLVRAEIFEHPDWIELDRGAISLEQAVVRGVLRTGLPREDIENLFNQVPPSLTPIEETIELIRLVRGSGNKLFVLSNMQYASIAYLESKHTIWNMFDGIVISCRIRKVKPEIGIFQHLLDEYGLDATETIFIDDTRENLVAASSMGIRTIKFVDACQCRQELVALNCI